MRRLEFIAATVLLTLVAAGCSRLTFVKPNLKRHNYQQVAPDYTVRDDPKDAQRVASIDHVGVLCVEFFVLRDGTLVANEMAPRPHNSGHYSIDACDVSQFELQVRAMTGAPLLAPRLHSPCVMLNLLGDLWLDGSAPDWREVLGVPGAHLHLYGKDEARPGRKMGHLTITAASAAEAEARAGETARRLGLGEVLAVASRERG